MYMVEKIRFSFPLIKKQSQESIWFPNSEVHPFSLCLEDIRKILSVHVNWYCNLPYLHFKMEI